MKKWMPLKRPKNTHHVSQLKGNRFHSRFAKPKATPAAPYSHQVYLIRMLHKELNIFVFACSNRWERAKNRNATKGPGCGLVLPPEATPEMFKWPVLGQRVVVVVDEYKTRADCVHFATVLYQQGAISISVVSDKEDMEPLYVMDAAGVHHE